jgi:hypothetical protein
MEAKRNVKELLIALGKGGMNYNAIADHNAQLTALQLMAIQNRADMVHLLIQLGARLREEATSGDGKTALHCACASTPPSIETIILLIQSGSAVNARDAEMNTPLHLSSSEQVADILIAAGANIQAKNSSKQKALFHVLAASQGLPKELQTQYNKAEKTADKREAVQLDGEPLDSTHELWMEDEKHEKCVTCVKAFGTFTRRHHCRRCGLVLCDKCSPKRGYETTSPKTKLRLCDGCFNSLNDPVNHELYEVPSTTQISAVSTTTVVISEPELVPQQRNSISQLRPLEEDSLLEPESPRSVRFASLKVDNRQSENMFAGNRARASALYKPGDLERLEEAGGDEFKREDSGLRTISITSSNITAVQQSKATPIAGGQMENDLDDLFATPPQ